jgi:hypothetical protein
MHIKGETKNGYDGNLCSDKYCHDGATCGKECVIERADYKGTSGVYASGDGLVLTLVTHCQYSTKVGIGLYLPGEGQNLLAGGQRDLQALQADRQARRRRDERGQKIAASSGPVFSAWL